MTTYAPQRRGQRRRPLVVAAVAVAAAALSTAVALDTAAAATAPRTILAPGDDLDRIANVFGAPGIDQVRVEYHTDGGKLAMQYLHARAGSTQHQDFGATVQYLDIGSGELAVGAPNFKPNGAGINGDVRGAIEIYKVTSKGLVWAQRIVGSPGPSHLGAQLATGPNTSRHDKLIASETRASQNVIVFARNSANTAFTFTGAARMTTPPVTALAWGQFDTNAAYEVAVGSSSVDANAGQVTVFSVAGTPLHAEELQTLKPAPLGLTSATAAKFGAALAAGIRGEDVLDNEGKHLAYAGGPSLVIGAPGTDSGAGAIVSLNATDSGLDTAGAAITRESDVWPDPAQGAGYGSAILVGRVTGDIDPQVVVGAPNARVSDHANAGAVFVTNHRITLATKGVPLDPQHDAYFGHDLAMPKTIYDVYGPLPGQVFVGAPHQDYISTDTGAAFFFPGDSLDLGAAKSRAVNSLKGAQLGQSVDVTH